MAREQKVEIVARNSKSSKDKEKLENSDEVGDAELVLTFDDTAANRAGIEAGALTVLGEKLSGGHS